MALMHARYEVVIPQSSIRYIGPDQRVSHIDPFTERFHVIQVVRDDGTNHLDISTTPFARVYQELGPFGIDEYQRTISIQGLLMLLQIKGASPKCAPELRQVSDSSFMLTIEFAKTRLWHSRQIYGVILEREILPPVQTETKWAKAFRVSGLSYLANKFQLI